jgi:hypothetical protein
MLFSPVFACTEPRSVCTACPGPIGEPRSTASHSLIPLPSPVASSISFRINTCKSVSKQTTLTIFRINTYEKHRGVGVLLLTRNPRKDFYPEEPAAASTRRGVRVPPAPSLSGSRIGKGPSQRFSSPSPEPESFAPAGETLAFRQSRVTSLPAEAGEPRVREGGPPFLSHVPLRPRRHGAKMLLNVVLTPLRETSPLLPVSKSMSRADAGCGNVIPPSPGQVSCRKAAWPGKHPQGCGFLRAGKAGSVRLGQHALLEP